MFLSEEQIKEKIKVAHCCSNCKHHYISKSRITNLRCKKFKDETLSAYNNDLMVFEDNVCDEWEGYYKND